MAACAHVWHYKCISRLLHSPDYPMFQCPNCRAFTDLSAEVDDTNDLDVDSQEPANAEECNQAALRSETQSPANVQPESRDQEIQNQLEAHPEEPDLATDVENLHLQDEQTREVDAESSDSAALNGSTDDLARSATVNLPGWQPTEPLNVPIRHAQLRADTPGSDENPLTPRNDSGPLAFDGRAGMP